ncbi:MAG: ABC transporter ATP-binding protein [Gammaproteobacteria bacterium]|nr:ABC transporter ATP-binding protein [Gammaproteobacteria bacterium]
MTIAIKVENLSKKYIISHEKKTQGYKTLSESLMHGGKRIANKIIHPFSQSEIDSQTQEEFWALKDINFEINQGDKVGIIGRNGAGKSTLLKVLSRITDPTSGKIHINGRIASLLEVGTGFHPELTGRENIYLNGAILGMSRKEIKLKFDEIVAFAEVEKFLDTPVKRYSSGMYVRLAFAVAAHLESEILVVDEVLAVGDAQFQKKCLGKMDDVSKEGRTILFVSHNMAALRKLCSRAIMLEQAQLFEDKDSASVIERYLTFSGPSKKNKSEVFWDKTNGPSCEEMELCSIRLINPYQQAETTFDATKEIIVEICFRVKRVLRGVRIVLSLLNSEGIVIFSTTNHNAIAADDLPINTYKASCIIPANLLNNTHYLVNVHIGIPGVKVLLKGKEYLSFTVEGAEGHGSTFSENWPGVVAPRLTWSLVPKVSYAE